MPRHNQKAPGHVSLARTRLQLHIPFPLPRTRASVFHTRTVHHACTCTPSSRQSHQRRIAHGDEAVVGTTTFPATSPFRGVRGVPTCAMAAFIFSPYEDIALILGIRPFTLEANDNGSAEIGTWLALGGLAHRRESALAKWTTEHSPSMPSRN